MPKGLTGKDFGPPPPVCGECRPRVSENRPDIGWFGRLRCSISGRKTKLCNACHLTLEEAEDMVAFFQRVVERKRWEQEQAAKRAQS